MAEYQVLTTTMAGVPYAEIANASIDFLTWELNHWGELSFRLPVTDPQAWAELREEYQTEREVQVWRNGALIWWGVYVAATADQDTVTFTCYGLLWYFVRRFFGPIISNTTPVLLTNGDFEATPIITGSPFGGWATVGSVTVTSSTSRRRAGARSAKLVTAGVEGDNFYMIGAAAVPTPARIRPLTWIASAYHYRETVNTGDPTRRGLVMFPTDGAGVLNGAYHPALVAVDEPLGIWVRREATMTLPAGFVGYVAVALLAPASGTVYYDDVRLTYEQRTGAVEGEDWGDSYFRRIASYGAGLTGGGGPTNTWHGAPTNKSNLNMTFTGSAFATAPMPSDLYWDHADEGNIYAAMTDLAARNVLDYEITWAANGRSRTITTYVPRKGSTKLGLAAELGRNIVSFRYDADGRRRTNDVRVSGRGTGTLREVGQAGGPTVGVPPQLEDVLSPPFELEGQQLIDLATTELARLTDPVKTPTLTVAAGLYMGDVQPGGTAEAGAPVTVGDTIPVRMDHGWVQEAGNRRIVKMTLRPATETLDLVLNA